MNINKPVKNLIIIPIIVSIFSGLNMVNMSNSSDLEISEPPLIIRPPEQVDIKDGFDKLYKVYCDKFGLDNQCVKDIKAIAIKESNENPKAIGDSGKSYGMFQIYLPSHKDITVAMAQDLKLSISWTIKHLIAYGYPEQRTLSIQCHNGCFKNNGYAESVNKISQKL
jgi:hypothetical protein